VSAVWSHLVRALQRAQATTPWRVWSHYGQARGNVLAGGIAYSAFFSLFPALAVGFTVFGLVLGASRSLQVRVADYVNSIFNSVVIGTTEGTGVVSIDTLVQQTDALTLTGVGFLVVLLFTGLGWVEAMRQGIRAVFGLGDEGNPVLAKLLDVVVLGVTGLGLLASIVASVALSSASGAVLDWVGVSDESVARFLVSFVVEVALLGFDVLLFLMFFRLLARVRLPLMDLLGGALVGAVGLFALKLGGGLLLRLASNNRWLGASLVVGLLVWFNLFARLTLVAASWSATAQVDRAGTSPAPDSAGAAQVGVAEAAIGAGTDAALRGQGTPTYGVRAADRTTIAAGAVLGATAVLVVGAVGRALGSVLRRPDADRDPD
jgi:membrane protein